MQERLLISFPFLSLRLVFFITYINCTLWHVLKWVNSWLTGEVFLILLLYTASFLPTPLSIGAIYFACDGRKEQEVNQIINNVYKDAFVVTHF